MDIIINTTKLGIYGKLSEMAEMTGKDGAFVDGLWESMLACEELYNEFAYYVQTGNIQIAMRVEGYSLIDLYVHRIDRYNIANDTGKNTEACNKAAMILETFKAMADLRADPAGYIKLLNDGRGLDKM